MKRTNLILVMMLTTVSTFGQDIFKEYGLKEPLTLSKGRYRETFTNDETVQIGTVLLNTKTNKIVEFLEEDTTVYAYKAENTSRWLSPDPLAEKYPEYSPYVFCANNPIRFVDPDGRKIEFAQGSSLKFIGNFIKAAMHLYMNKSADLLSKVIASPNIYIIKEGSMKSSFSLGTKTITWDSNMGIITNEGHVLSPTTVLNHELDHVAQFDENPEKQRMDMNTSDVDYRNKEEKRVIENSEQTTAKNLGEIKEGEVTRRDHKGVLYETKGPTSTVGKGEIEGVTVTAPKLEELKLNN
jgi:hypothetical protein